MEKELSSGKCCPCCGSGQSLPFLCSSDNLTQTPGTYNYVKCLACGSIYQSPIPTQQTLYSYYRSDYPVHQRYKQGFEQQMSIGQRYGLIKKRRAIEKYVKKGQLLDVGCARGDFLFEMKTAGWQVVGLEPIEAAAHAGQIKGLDILQGNLETVDFPSSSFDIVTLWDVLEHVRDPRLTLHQVYNLLKPGGLVVFSTPNADSVDAKIFGDSWLGYDPPRHVCIFTLRSLMDAITRAGFSVMETMNLTGTQAYFQTSLNVVLRKKMGVNTSRILMTIMSSLPIRMLMAPAFYAYGRAKMGFTITVIAMKPSR